MMGDSEPFDERGITQGIFLPCSTRLLEEAGPKETFGTQHGSAEEKVLQAASWQLESSSAADS